MKNESIHTRLLFGDLAVNEGMIAENAVAQMLAATGRNLHFYSKSDESERKNRMEIDFLIAKSKVGRRKNIIPIEVKSGKNLAHRSLDKFRARFGDCLGTPFLLHPGDFSEKDGILRVSLYMAPFL